jgi:glyoxalase family protein
VPGIENEAAWAADGIPAEHAIRGFHSASLLVREAAPTGAILTDIFGFTEIGREGSRIRYRAGDTALGGIIDLREAGNVPRGRSGAGTVHHIAWASRDEDHLAWQARIRAAGGHVTDVRDRDYFKSIYFGEPRGVLFEIATLSPGFAIDEDPAHLGEALRLPAMHEHLRDQLERILTPVANPRVAA